MAVILIQMQNGLESEMTKRKLTNILVTGGCGFIGCNFIHYLFGESTAGGASFTDSNFQGRIINVDCLTYAGNAESDGRRQREPDPLHRRLQGLEEQRGLCFGERALPDPRR